MTQSHADRIEAALHTPSLLEEVEGQFVMAQAHFMDSGIPEDANDFYPVTIGEHVPSPSVVYANSLDDLHEIALMFSRMKKGGVEFHDLAKRLKHQEEHADIIHQLGGTSVHGLQIGVSRDGTQTEAAFIFAPSELTTTKLGLALVAAYPRVPTPEDEAFMHTLGYSRGTEEVVVHAMMHGLPVPLSLDH